MDLQQHRRKLAQLTILAGLGVIGCAAVAIGRKEEQRKTEAKRRRRERKAAWRDKIQTA